jgi:MFS transporter, NRE family, putaive nickel resistance protein
MSKPLGFFHSLQNRIFARLFFAQTINLMGDALSWLGFALLAFELAGNQAAAVLSLALTLRVTAFIIFSPMAGLMIDRLDRKGLMVTAHLLRMGLICLLPWVTEVSQLYLIVLLLSSISAFFTPTYMATVPLVTQEEERQNAIAMSSATYQILGVFGPGIAGAVAAQMGLRQLFWIDGVTFLIAAVLIASIPKKLTVTQPSTQTLGTKLADIWTGSLCLWSDRPMRYGLLLQLITAITGAQILVNTVTHVQNILRLGKLEYGWTMAAFGIGATLASLSLSRIPRKHIHLPTLGAGLAACALLPANVLPFSGLLILLFFAGMGQALVNLPMQMLIADRVSIDLQGRVYSAQFAWSHLWWAFSYPLAGWIGLHSPSQTFFYSSLLSTIALGLVIAVFGPQSSTATLTGLWHEHHHLHEAVNHHTHAHHNPTLESHSHLHFHPPSELH